MQTTSIEKTYTQHPKRIKEKEIFITKLQDALIAEELLSKVIRGPFTRIPETMPVYNPRRHTITYVARSTDK